MIRPVISILSVLFCVLYVNAQNKTTLLQRINEIKGQSDTYFWDQYTHPNADTAKVGATQRLLLDANCHRSETSQLSVEEVMPFATYILLDRGSLKQYFVYIKKEEAMAIKNGARPITESVKPDATPVNVTSPVTPVTTVSVQKSFIPDAFVQRIMGTKDFVNVYKLLKSMQTQGQILQFGRLKDVGDYSSLDLILFDMQSQQIITVLSSVTASGNRTNMVDGTEDSLDNYPTGMTAVIWYIKK